MNQVERILESREKIHSRMKWITTRMDWIRRELINTRDEETHNCIVKFLEEEGEKFEKLYDELKYGIKH